MKIKQPKHIYAQRCRSWDIEHGIIQRLRYIADSPSEKHGGFHRNAIQTAKDAIRYIKSNASNPNKATTAQP